MLRQLYTRHENGALRGNGMERYQAYLAAIGLARGYHKAVEGEHSNLDKTKNALA